jgi:heterodisulfide reductase subunit A
VKVFYLDIRAFGKGFEDLFKRSRELGVKYIRGVPGEVEEDPATRNLNLWVEDTSNGKVQRHEVELVVLSVGVEPRQDSELVKSLLTLSRSADGFFLEAHPKLQPVDAPTRGVFFAGCAEGPKDIKDSVTQASAAAARANVLMKQGQIKVEAITAEVIAEKCRLCGRCTQVCPYHAIEFDKKSKQPAQVITAACAGCGTCAAECPFDAIVAHHFEDHQIISQIEVILSEKPAEKVVVFACNWCSYAGGDFAGMSRLQYPPNVRLIRTMCSGRVAEKFVLKAFELGAPVVLVSGCHFADCHYIDANRWTQRRVDRLWEKLERLGIRPQRLQLEWISAAEGLKFARVMKEMEQLRKTVTPQEIERTIKVLKEEGQKKSKRRK